MSPVTPASPMLQGDRFRTENSDPESGGHESSLAYVCRLLYLVAVSTSTAVVHAFRPPVESTTNCLVVPCLYGSLLDVHTRYGIGIWYLCLLYTSDAADE